MNLFLKLRDALAISILLVIGLIPDIALADQAKACSKQQSSICAQLKSTKPLNSKEEGRFVVEVSGVDPRQIRILRAELWMDVCTSNSAHGSAPLTVSSISKNQIGISNAWFVMPGIWLVKTTIETTYGNFLVEIPVFISN